MLGFFLSIINHFIPPDKREVDTLSEMGEEVRKARLIIGFSFLCAILVNLMAAVRFWAEGKNASPTLILLPVFALVVFFNPFIIRYRWNLIVPSLISMIGSFALIPLRVVSTGGMSSAVITWFCTLPIWFGLTWSGRAAVVSAAFSTVALFLIAHPGLIGMSITPHSIPPTAQFIVAAIAVCCIALAVGIYENQRKRYNKTLSEKKTALEKEKEQTEKLNGFLSTMLNSVGQGFLIFDRKGLCLPTFSKACETLLHKPEPGKSIWQILSISTSQLSTYELWLRLIFDGRHEFDNLKGLGPKQIVSPLGAIVQLEYFPVSQNGELVSIVAVATDVTKEVKAREQAARDRAQANMVLKMARNNLAFVRFNMALKNFLLRFQEQLDEVDKNHAELYRIMHTIKGTASTLSMMDVAQQAHSIESLLVEFKNKPFDRPVLRPKITEALNDLTHLHHQVLSDFASVIGGNLSSERHYRRVADDQVREFYRSISSKNSPTALKEEFSRLFILEPIAEHFMLYDEMCQELAKQLFKRAKPLKIINGELLIDPLPYLNLFESFVHAFRNAVDHGFELPSHRHDLGKDEAGQITVSFDRIHRGTQSWLRIEVQDDGAGIQPEKIREKAQKLGLIQSDQNLTEDEILQFIFSSQLSTKSQASQTSGRGVGLDALKAEALRLGGRVKVESHLNQGTCLTVEVPEATGATGLIAA